MRILVLTTTFPRWKNDTTPAFVYELSKRLHRNGLDVIVLAPHHKGAKKFEIMDGMKVYRFPYFLPSKYQKLVYEGGILPNIKRSNLAKIQVPLLILSELYYAFKIIKREKIDVIHSHWIIPSGLVGGILKKVLGKKHILTIHAAGILALEKLPLKKNIAGFIIKYSDNITVVSSYIYEKLLDLIQTDSKNDIKNKTKTIPMGVDTSLFKSKIERNELKKKYDIKSKNTLLFIGRLAEKKGLSYLIKAMPEIISKNPNSELIICGDGPMRKDLQQQVDDLKLENFVRFVGYITDNEKIDYLKLSDILIVPSIVTHSGDTEGLPVVILEGLASGKAIIGSDVGGIRDVIKDGYNGFLIKQKNPDDIAEKVLKLIYDKELNTKISKAALRTAKEYDWKVIGNRYEEIIRNVESEI